MAADEENEAKAAIVREALATYFDCETEDVKVWIVCCEHNDSEGGLMFSSAWSLLPHWHLTGFVDELKNHIEQQRNRAALESMLSGGEEESE